MLIINESFLKEVVREYEARLASIDGGSLRCNTS